MLKLNEKLIYLFVVGIVLNPLVVSAEEAYKGIGGSTKSLEAVGKVAGGPKDLPTTVGNLINVLLGTLGIIFVILVIYAGILYMTASGDDTKVKKAKTLLTQAVIGMIILVSAYAIASFVLSQIQGATISVGP